MADQDFERLGVFYLGREYDLAKRERGKGLLLYDSRDLVTHAVCVGMTGSGKTGLCIGLLEEAAIDGIPAIVIDPKGDLGNLLLTFPQLRPEDFAPWINPDDARRKGLEPAAHAAKQAETWSKGLAEWGQDGARIQRLRDSAEFAIYTPGSNAGIGVSVLKSFAVPPPAIMDDSELLGERISSTTTSLLGLLGVDADPLQSREHILLSNILDALWRDGKDADLAGLIQAIQTPPLKKLGVMDLDTFYPPKDRFALAMQLNNLIAAPGFSQWIEGVALDIQTLLYTPAGKPRVAVFSIAHLDDAQRMFFVSLLLNQMLGWVRTQSGTTSLRAILYMDEIAGYLPPVANPPSKPPLLTLMKQARAFGVGVVLATQNPVDLDYKALSNAGTWFLGRLQTERDKARVLDGLEGAMASAGGASFDRQSVDALLSQLSTRVFLMNNIHEDGPVIFETRWAMSYLRGPLTRNEIKTLMTNRRGTAAVAGPNPTAAAPNNSTVEQPAPARNTGAATSPVARTSQRPVLPPEIEQYFLPATAAATYQPMLLGMARIAYSDSKLEINTHQSVCLLAPVRDGPAPVDWQQAQMSRITRDDLVAQAPANAAYSTLPAAAANPKSYEAWRKEFAAALQRRCQLTLLRSPSLKMTSEPGEDEPAFRVRLSHAAREQRDAMAEKLRQRYAPKLATLQDRIRRAEQAVEVQRQQASQSKVQAAVSFGAAILGAFTGRKVASAGNVGRAGSAMKGVGRTMKESGDVSRAGENVAALRAQAAALDAEFQSEVNDLASRYDPLTEELDSTQIKPKRGAVEVQALVLAWVPSAAAQRAASGTASVQGA